MISFSIDPAVASKFAGLNIGMVQGTCSANRFSDAAGFETFKTEGENRARLIPILAENPHLAAWRKTFKAFGADPSKTKPSVEALVRRVQKGESLPRINPVVDVYNAVSLFHVLPLGGQDAEKIRGPVGLRFSKPEDVFSPLGGEEKQAVDAGEVVYADAGRVLCRKWNWRDCADARITDATTNFVLFVDGCPGIAPDKVEKAAEQLAEMLVRNIQGCAAESRVVNG